MGPEDNQRFSDFWHKKRMPFTGIPDPEHAIANLYGQKVNYLKFGRMPALFVIDREGRIRYQHYGSSMSDIPENKEVLSLLDKLNNETTG